VRWWPWSKAPVPEPGVTEDEKAELERLTEDLNERHRRMDERTPEVEHQVGYLRRKRRENHIAEGFRRALEGR
jgi:hypothetical protein